MNSFEKLKMMANVSKQAEEECALVQVVFFLPFWFRFFYLEFDIIIFPLIVADGNLLLSGVKSWLGN